MSDFRKYLLELDAFYKNQAQCKQSLGGATAALSDERISKLFGHLINEFDAANNRLQWISVDDRLPELDQDVLSVDKSGRVYNSTWRGNHFKCVGLVWEHDNVTHWMPFPEPPTQEQGE